jgi:hypothetical protein
VNVALRALFEAPTVAGLAEAVEGALLDGVDPRELADLVEQVGVDGTRPVTRTGHDT